MLAHFNSMVIKQQFFSKCVAIQRYINFLLNYWNELDKERTGSFSRISSLLFSTIHFLNDKSHVYLFCWKKKKVQLHTNKRSPLGTKRYEKWDERGEKSTGGEEETRAESSKPAEQMKREVIQVLCSLNTCCSWKSWSIQWCILFSRRLYINKFSRERVIVKKSDHYITPWIKIAKVHSYNGMKTYLYIPDFHFRHIFLFKVPLLSHF